MQDARVSGGLVRVVEACRRGGLPYRLGMRAALAVGFGISVVACGGPPAVASAPPVQEVVLTAPPAPPSASASSSAAPPAPSSTVATAAPPEPPEEAPPAPSSSDPLASQGGFGVGGLGLSGTGNPGLSGIGGSFGTGSGGIGLGSGMGRVAPTVPLTIRAEQTTVHGKLPVEIVRRIVRSEFGKLRACYEAGLRKAPALAGKVTVSFVIGADGAVRTSALGPTTMPDKTVSACVLRTFAALGFPKPESGEVSVGFPLVFSPPAPPAPAKPSPPPAPPPTKPPLTNDRK